MFWIKWDQKFSTASSRLLQATQTDAGSLRNRPADYCLRETKHAPPIPSDGSKLAQVAVDTCASLSTMQEK